ncbi:Uncharacterized membrane protein SpoIIM, required for sporulation [Quadrisphaera granulorum]|uniref:Putative membrane protein SpoIIM required for sporulation n=1 Tax=Quadrisphaera granulorum TaxID=317664 RepID=A0A316AD40_9ACTN|nr:stage II sporulation protein M [Quadrisphaera granulorum]PWJ54804.1 putative membrane protein SpoIIM required for sporulation [Quadrisphaera granulorum]SZE95750.1 Uncharacterized membrane protein SpoIIM, required for sporulation [Quadrisphaera granulorum]
MDAEAFAAVHSDEWDELEQLLRRRHLTGAQADRLVLLYQRAATHLSQVRSSGADPAVVAHLSRLVARARTRLAGAREPAWRDLARFVTTSFPAALWRVRWWTAGAAAFTVLVGTATAVWIVRDPAVLASLGTDEQLRQYVESDFAGYYSADPAAAFSARVWTNNAWIAAQCVIFGVSGIWVPIVLFQNAVGIGQAAGLMISYGQGPLFFGLIIPHGLLELTSVFVAAGAGLKLFWALVDPGPRPRSQALAEEGRALVTVALGLVVVLALSGLVEGFVTPSGLPTWARIGIGALALAAFLVYGGVLGRRATRRGETGDIREEQREAVQPIAG